MKRGKTEGRKLIFEEGEHVWVQCVKSGKWKDKGVIDEIRVADDGTIKSYGVIINGVKTTRHRMSMANLANLENQQINRDF